MIAPPMPLATKLAFQFERRLQFQGINLFHARAVRITEANQAHLFGDVQGTSRYPVRLIHQDGRLLVYCACSYFAGYGRCKHLWAAILEADRRGVLGEATRGGALRLCRDADPDEAVELARWQVDPPQLPQLPPPQTPPWQEYLSDIRQSLDAKKLKAAAWPREHEILYVVDPSASKLAGAIVLELLSRSRKKNGDWTVNKEFRIAPSQVGFLPDPVDAEAIASILGGQEYYLYTYAAASGVAARKAVPHILALRLIPLVAATGRLFTRKMSSTDLQPLAWDEGEPWKLWLDVRQDDRDQWKITGSLRRGEERMLLTEPSLIVEGGFLVALGKIARLDDGGAFPWIARLIALKQIPFPVRKRDLLQGDQPRDPGKRAAIVQPRDLAQRHQESAFHDQRRLGQQHALLAAAQRAGDFPLVAVVLPHVQPQFPGIALVPGKRLQVRGGHLAGKQPAGSGHQGNQAQRQYVRDRLACRHPAGGGIGVEVVFLSAENRGCLLYTSDAADE